MRTFNIFVSHSWNYTDEYNGFINLLERRSYFNFRNYSVPNEKPKDTSTDKELKIALEGQIRPTHIVIILAGMYANYSKWINIEMNIAKKMGKPMIGIRPYGGQRVPTQVSSEVNEIIAWNTESIVDAIRRNALI